MDLESRRSGWAQTCVPAQDTVFTQPISSEEKRAALSSEWGLDRNLAALLSQVQSSQPDYKQLEEAILTAQQHAAVLKAFVSKTIEPTFYNERHLDASTAAQRTFDVAELLEMILDHLNVPDILSMSQVSRSIRESIEASTRMQEKLSLRPASIKSHLYTPFLRCLRRSHGGFICSFKLNSNESTHFLLTRPGADNLSANNEASVELRAEFSTFPGQRLPRIGSTYRRMFICQPPIKEMSVYMRCCAGEQYSDTASGTEVDSVTAEDGLTIGQLYDCAKKLMEEHRWCRHAFSPNFLEEDGVVKTGLYFTGFTELLPEDPILEERSARKTAAEAERQRNIARDAKFREYGRTKMNAYHNGEPIPTLHEFEAANAGINWAERKTRFFTLQDLFAIQGMPYTLPPATSNNIMGNSNAISSTGVNQN